MGVILVNDACSECTKCIIVVVKRVLLMFSVLSDIYIGIDYLILFSLYIVLFRYWYAAKLL